MIAEQRLISPYNGNSELLRDVHGFLKDFAPKYIDALYSFALGISGQLDDKYGPIGWGVFGSFDRLLLPGLFTGRGLCELSTDLLSNVLQPKFKELEIAHGSGYLPKFNEPSRPSQGCVHHNWLLLSDPYEVIKTGYESAVILDSTIKQIVPDAPFMLFTEESSPHEDEVEHFEYTPIKLGLERYDGWLQSGEDITNNPKEDALTKLITVITTA